MKTEDLQGWSFKLLYRKKTYLCFLSDVIVAFAVDLDRQILETQAPLDQIYDEEFNTCEWDLLDYSGNLNIEWLGSMYYGLIPQAIPQTPGHHLAKSFFDLILLTHWLYTFYYTISQQRDQLTGLWHLDLIILKLTKECKEASFVQVSILESNEKFNWLHEITDDYRFASEDSIEAEITSKYVSFCVADSEFPEYKNTTRLLGKP